MSNNEKNSKKRHRLVVFRSNKYIYAQIIDDKNGKTLVTFSNKDIKNDTKKKTGKIDESYKIGYGLAEKAKKLKILKIKFDRNEYKYHGRVKALAEGAREGGLMF